MNKLDELYNKIEQLNIEIRKMAAANDMVFISGTYLLDNQTNEHWINFNTTDNAIEVDIYKATATWTAAGVEQIEEAEEPGENDLIL